MILSLNKHKLIATSGSDNMSSSQYKQVVFRFAIAFLVLGIFSATIGCTNGSDTLTVSEKTSNSVPEATNPRNVNKDNLLTIHTTTSIISDWVKIVGGERVVVESLTPAGKDPHTYQPTPRQVARLSDSKLVISIGLSLEGQNISTLLQHSLSPNAMRVELGPETNPIKLNHHLESGHQGHDDAYDPHFWLDPSRTAIAIKQIQNSLTVIDPEGTDYYSGNASDYIKTLSDIDKSIRSTYDRIPRSKKMLVTSHEALGYLEDAYGLQIIGSVIPALSTDSGPTASDLADLIDLIQLTKAPAIFMEEGIQEKVTTQIARDTNIKIIEGLRVEYLNEGESYLQMIKRTAELIHKGLR
jgi:ABC-type Zn uptake system ZnuABC Zn-binding protein ZnuA|tara:strand:- start:198 stop:1262 length:1065 start_codon:yes stop_codon:yes gene_type:complete